MGVAQDMLGSLVGMTETAYLIVSDSRETQKPPEGSENQTAGPVGNLEKAAKKAKELKKQADIVAKSKDILMKETATIEGGVPSVAGEPISAQAVDKYFKVQFNPAEMTVNTSNDATSEKSTQNAAGGEEKPQAQTQGGKVTSVLSIVLYFDKMNKADAFNADKFNVSASGLVSNATTAVLKATNKEWSVRPQVEALISAIRNSATRAITFHWSTFEYKGSLNFISAKYTMFSLTGEPVRAQVSIRIQQDVANASGWHDNYKKAFASNSSLVTAGQKVSGLLNLNL